jgi:hypothetical protein
MGLLPVLKHKTKLSKLKIDSYKVSEGQGFFQSLLKTGRGTISISFCPLTQEGYLLVVPLHES